MQENLQKGLQLLQKEQEEMEQLLRQLVKIESPSAAKEGVDQVSNCIKEFCDRCGFHTTSFFFPKAGATLIVDSATEAQDPSPVLLLAHMDTVHAIGSFGTEILTEDESFFYGPGVFDCKGGIVIALYVMKTLAGTGYNRHPVRLILSGDEETGHVLSEEQGIQKILEYAKGGIAAFNCESGMMDGRIAVARKGIFNVSYLIYGVAAHSGNAPEQGRNAILEAAHKVIAVEQLTDFQGTTYNCGVIHGGKTSSTVPDECRVDICVRFREKKAADTAMKKLQEIAEQTYIEGTVTEMVVTAAPHGPMEDTEENRKLFEMYRQAVEETGGMPVTPYMAGGASDSFYTTEARVPTICGVGIRGSDNHSPKERALKESLAERTQALLATIWTL